MSELSLIDLLPLFLLQFSLLFLSLLTLSLSLHFLFIFDLFNKFISTFVLSSPLRTIFLFIFSVECSLRIGTEEGAPDFEPKTV